MKRKSRLSRRITWRVILIIVIINVFIIGAVLLSSLALSFWGSKVRAQHLMDGIENKLETMFQVVKATAINNKVEVEANLDSPAKVFDALERELQVNKSLVGCFAAFEPGYYKDHGRWFEAYAHFTDSTQIERQQLGSSLHDYFNGVWYKKGLSLEKDDDGYLTDPYYDNSVGNSLYCSYVLPIFDRQGRKVGVYGVDLDLGWIDSTIVKEEKSIKKIELVEDSPDDPDNVNAFFIQLLDSKGKRISGTIDVDEKTLKEIWQRGLIENKRMQINDESYYVSSKRLPNTGWTLTMAQHWEWVFLDGISLGICILFFMTIGGLIIFLFLSRSIRRAIKPLGFLSTSAQEVAKGNFDTLLPTFKHDDEVAELRDSFDTMQHSLKQYVKELKETTASKAAIESELHVAQNIQKSMLPKTYPPFPERNDIEIFGSQTPAKAVGGDLYDFFIHDEKLFFCIGDVSGKGVPASLVMAVTRTLFRNISAHSVHPGQIMESMNMNVCEGNDNNMFVTLFVGVLDLKTGVLRYSNAGHDAPYVENTFLPCDSNLPIGIIPNFKYSEQTAKFVPGTTIFMYTDGLTEAENAAQELFHKHRMTEVLKATMQNPCSPQQLIESMTAAVHQFVGNTEQSDDLTMLAIKYTNSSI